MPSYAFRISCRIATCSFDAADRAFTLTLPHTPPIQVTQPASESLILLGGGFSSEHAARSVGEPVKVALMLTGLLLGSGIDAGADELLSSAATLAGGVPHDLLQPDVLGLHVYPEAQGNTWFGFLRAGAPFRTTSPPEFHDKMVASLTLASQLTAKQLLATHLYAQSHFHTSSAARFLLLISAVEALAVQPLRSEKSRIFLEHMVNATKQADIEDNDRSALISAIGNLRRQSISRTCRELVTLHCGTAHGATFSNHYEIRSGLLHRGEQHHAKDLRHALVELDTIARLLITKHITASCSGGAHASS